MGTIHTRYFCDLCQNEIHSGRRFSTLTVPMSTNDRAAIREAILGDLPAHMREAGQFGAMMAESQIPNVWTYLVCMGCVIGLLPDALAMKTAKIKELLAERSAQMARTVEDDEIIADASARVRG